MALAVGLLALVGCGGQPTAAGPAGLATAGGPPPTHPVLLPTALPSPSTVSPSPRASASASPVAAASASPARTAVAATPSGSIAGGAALPTVETAAAVRGSGFLTPVELDLVFQQPLTDSVELQRLVDGVQQLDGITAVRSDGVHILLRYDSSRVLPTRIRDRLRELGHPAVGGTDVQNPGDAAD
jgi:hypothetical protein